MSAARGFLDRLVSRSLGAAPVRPRLPALFERADRTLSERHHPGQPAPLESQRIALAALGAQQEGRLELEQSDSQPTAAPAGAAAPAAPLEIHLANLPAQPANRPAAPAAPSSPPPPGPASLAAARGGPAPAPSREQPPRPGIQPAAIRPAPLPASESPAQPRAPLESTPPLARRTPAEGLEQAPARAPTSPVSAPRPRPSNQPALSAALRAAVEEVFSPGAPAGEQAARGPASPPPSPSPAAFSPAQQALLAAVQTMPAPGPEAPPVRIEIGRVEVQVSHPPPVKARKNVPRTPALSLDAYLKGRDSDERR